MGIKMIEFDNIFEDLRKDAIGQAICALRAIPKWNLEKHKFKDELITKLIEHGYVKSVSTRAHFRMRGGIGFSYLYLVPEKKRGRFSIYSGQLLRLVYVASAKDYLEIRFGVVDRGQVGRSFCSMTSDQIAENFDPRRYFQFAFGESSYNIKNN